MVAFGDPVELLPNGKAVMWFELPAIWIAVTNVVFVPLVHLGVSWFFTKCFSSESFHPDRWPFRIEHWESSGRIYDRVFVVRRWKNCIPDGATWFGGFAKKELSEKSAEFFQEFRRETCRGEAAHWAQVILLMFSITWNPGVAAVVMIAYSFLSNLPCIIIQRHTRARLGRVLQKTEG